MTSRAGPPHPASGAPSRAPADAQVNPDQEYEDATESKLDRTKPPQHEKTVTSNKHNTETQISIGKP